MFNHEERIAVLERIVKDLDRMYFVLLFAVCTRMCKEAKDVLSSRVR